MPSDPNINTGLGSQSNWTIPSDSTSTEGVTSVKGGSSKGKLPSIEDSIEQALITSYFIQYQMSQPYIVPPSSESVEALGQLSMAKIALSVLDKWSESLAKIAEEKREEEKRKALHPDQAKVDYYASTGIVMSIAIIFLRAIFGTTVAESLEKTDKLKDDKWIASKFSSQLQSWASEGLLKNYILSLLDQGKVSATLDEKTKELAASHLQLMVLFSALAALYKSETKWVTSEEVISLLNNKNEQNAQIAELSKLIKEELSSLPVQERNRLLKTVSVYLDTNPDLPTLFSLDKSTGLQMSIFHNSTG